MSAKDFAGPFSLIGRILLIAIAGVPGAARATTVAGDNFSTSHDYLANGVSGTIWSGVYTGAGSFPGGSVGALPGTTYVADANVSNPGELTVQSSGGGWSPPDDDGFFLYMNVSGDFEASVHVVSPFAATAYNQAGLLVRAANADGSPFGGSENWVSLDRFDQFGYGTLINSTLNGNLTQQALTGIDNNYWLRIDRVSGSNFYFYEKANPGDPWQLVGSAVNRPDLSGLSLQVGIMQGNYTANVATTEFSDFNLILVPEPSITAFALVAILLGVFRLRPRAQLVPARCGVKGEIRNPISEIRKNTDNRHPN